MISNTSDFKRVLGKLKWKILKAIKDVDWKFYLEIMMVENERFILKVKDELIMK